MANLDKVETDFRKESTWHSFKAGLYTTIGGAAAIALGGGIVQPLMAAAASKTGFLLALSGSFTLPAIGVIAAMGAICVLSLYLAQKETIESNYINDDRLALKNALAMRENFKGPNQELNANPTVFAEYSNQPRNDGRSWQEAIQPSTDVQRAM